MPRFHSLSTRFGIAFLLYVLVGSALLLGWLRGREQRQAGEVFAAMARADADFIRELRLPLSARLAEDVGRLLKMQVFFRDQTHSLVPVPGDEALLLPLAELRVQAVASRLPGNHEAIAVRLDELHDVVFLRDTPASVSSLRNPENLAALAAFAALSLALALGLSRTVVRPIRALTQRLPGFLDTGSTTPLPEAGRLDEIGQLAKALHEAREALASEREERARSERMALLGRMATGLAHEIKNPVAGITLHAQLLAESADEADSPDLAHGLRHILRSATEVDGLVNQWLFLTRPAPPAMARLDLVVCAREVLEALEIQATHAGVSCQLDDAAGPLWVNADRARLGQALRNLVLNAIQAMSGNGSKAARLLITARAIELPALAELRFIDSGPGFSAKALSQARELFFSEREGGMGVGLAVVAEVVQAHGGTLSLGNAEAGGAEVLVRLPRID